jgi:undecaprenyl diphosphate synthase
VPQLDLIIRTSGEKRTSGFMPLQSAYSEWYFSEKHFPDFGIEELHNALKDYETRERRHGK